MRVSSGIFEALEPGAVPGYAIRIYVAGSSFQQRAHPIMARVGNVNVERIFVAPDGKGFSGLLARAPKDGDRLYVRYADQTELRTGVVYGSLPVA